MSPLPPPPPAGTIIPSEDWTEDASFDFTEEEKSPSKPAATTPRGRISLGGLGLPLRQSFARPPSTTSKPEGVNDDDDDPDFYFEDGFENKDGTDSFPAFSTRLSSSTPTIANSNPTAVKSRGGGLTTKGLSSVVMGSGPGGIGTITKLASKPTALPKGSIKLKAAAVSKAWEEDMDFDDLGDGDGDDGDWKAKLSNGPKTTALGATKSAGTVGLDGGITVGPLIMKSRVMPDANALDDLDGFDLDDGEEDREATLKASATLKARLPPPKSKTANPHSSQTQTPPPPPPPKPSAEDDNLDNDADFDLPLNLTNLNLASRTGSSARTHQPKQSRMSGVSLDWDSPGTSTSTSGGGGQRAGWWSESPSKRFSETSGTSISDGITPAKGKGKGKQSSPEFGSANGVQNPKLLVSGTTVEDDDMEDGLVLPSKTFFATTSKRELDSLLDRKRKPQFAAHHAGDVTLRPGTSHSGRGFEEGMEDGLVFEDHGKELTLNGLTMGKKARSQIPIAMKRTTGTRLVPKDRTHIRDSIHQTPGNVRHPSHDLLGRTPALNALRERAQSTAGHRSHSTGNVNSSTIKPFSPTRPTSPPPQHGSPSKSSGLDRERERERDRDRDREREPFRSRSGQPFSSILPPSTPSRSGLRHQKSHQVLSSPSPAKSSGSGLMKKQSLSSLHDTYTASTVGPSVLQTLAEDPDATVSGEMKERYHSSTSRLTMPTSSSKAKSRPPISSVFPMTHPYPATSTASAAAAAAATSSGTSSSVNAHASSTSSTPGPQHSHTQSPPLSTRSKIRQVQQLMGTHPKRRDWGDGTELEGIEDLDVDVDEKDKKSSWSKSTRSKLMKVTRSVQSPEKRSRDAERHATREKESGGSLGRKKKRPPLLIKHLGTVDQKKVVGEMTWNPVKLRWEGNETALRDFDNIPISTSARPALITHISNPTSPTSLHLPGALRSGSSSSSILGSVNTGGSRIVGDMRFDPKEMRWISLSPDEEPDPFEGMADDEDDSIGKGGTIRARKMVTVGLSEASESLWSSSRKASVISSGTTSTSGDSTSSYHTSHQTPQPPFPNAQIQQSHNQFATTATPTTTTTTTTTSTSTVTGSDTTLIPDSLKAECKEAEDRHKKEMRGWISGSGSWSRSEARREEKRLWDIRYLALKS